MSRPIRSSLPVEVTGIIGQLWGWHSFVGSWIWPAADSHLQKALASSQDPGPNSLARKSYVEMRDCLSSQSWSPLTSISKHWKLLPGRKCIPNFGRSLTTPPFLNFFRGIGIRSSRKVWPLKTFPLDATNTKRSSVQCVQTRFLECHQPEWWLWKKWCENLDMQMSIFLQSGPSRGYTCVPEMLLWP